MIAAPLLEPLRYHVRARWPLTVVTDLTMDVRWFHKLFTTTRGETNSAKAFNHGIDSSWRHTSFVHKLEPNGIRMAVRIYMLQV